MCITKIHKASIFTAFDGLLILKRLQKIKSLVTGLKKLIVEIDEQCHTFYNRKDKSIKGFNVFFLNNKFKFKFNLL